MTKNILLIIFIVVSVSLFVLLIKQKGVTVFQDSGQDLKNTESVTNDVEDKSSTFPETNLVVGKTLDLSNQGLDKLPQSVLTKTDIEKLDISNNNITGALPAEIRHLQKLKILDASNNKMTGVPAEVGQLSNLEVLDLSNNQLTGLPYELGNLKKLKLLNLSGNDYAQQDLEKIKEGLPDSTEIIL